ncbi:MAG: DUF2085 domain-containing protein [Verrucomicrobiota bacterium]
MLSFLCHRLPERSFLWLWDPPLLCARCTGFYAAILLGVLWLLLRRGRGKSPPRAAVAAVAATLASMALEKALDLDVGNGIRCLTALPLGFVLGHGLALPLLVLFPPTPKDNPS